MIVEKSQIVNSNANQRKILEAHVLDVAFTDHPINQEAKTLMPKYYNTNIVK